MRAERTDRAQQGGRLGTAGGPAATPSREALFLGRGCLTPRQPPTRAVGDTCPAGTSRESGESRWPLLSSPGLPPPGQRPHGSAPAPTVTKQPGENAFHSGHVQTPRRTARSEGGSHSQVNTPVSVRRGWPAGQGVTRGTHKHTLFWGGETSDMPPSCCILRRRGLTSTQIQKSAEGKTSVVP